MKDIENNLKQFDELPVLIIWGSMDFCFNINFLNKWREVFPAAEIHVIDSAGHLVVEDSTKEVIERMRVFLGGHKNY